MFIFIYHASYCLLLWIKRGSLLRGTSGEAGLTVLPRYASGTVFIDRKSNEFLKNE